MIRTLALAAAATLLAALPAQAADWRRLDPDNTLVIDTSKGRIVVEMRPDFAPKAVERVKLLAREGEARVRRRQEAVKELSRGRHTHLTVRVGIGETKAENYTIHTALHLQCLCITHF